MDRHATVSIPAPKKPPQPPELSKREREAASRAANALVEIGDWAASLEGVEFWVALHARLKQMSERGY